MTERFSRHEAAVTHEFMHHVGLKGFAEFRRAEPKFSPLKRQVHAHIKEVELGRPERVSFL